MRYNLRTTSAKLRTKIRRTKMALICIVYNNQSLRTSCGKTRFWTGKKLPQFNRSRKIFLLVWADRKYFHYLTRNTTVLLEHEPSNNMKVFHDFIRVHRTRPSTKGRFNDLEVYGPLAPTGHGLCGFNRGWSYVAKSRFKSLATPCVTELNR